MARSIPIYSGFYREGAKKHCYFCGRPEREHKEGLCPGSKTKAEEEWRVLQIQGKAGRKKGKITLLEEDL